MLRWLVVGAVQIVLEAQAQAGQRVDLQLTLRVVKRGADRAEAILAPRWNRPGGYRAFLNWLKARRMKWPRGWA